MCLGPGWNPVVFPRDSAEGEGNGETQHSACQEQWVVHLHPF